MKRSEFFKSIGIGALAIASSPILKASEIKDKQFSFDEIFHQPYNNENLIYFKPETDIYKLIRRSVESKISEIKKLTYYLPERRIYIPIKKEYTMDDFATFIFFLEGYSTAGERFLTECDHDTFLRLFSEKDRMQLTLFIYTERQFS